MKANEPLCISCGVECPHCKCSSIIKSGKTALRKPRYRCKECKKRFILNYNYNACKPNLDEQIVALVKEGLGIRSSARLLSISTTTLLQHLCLIAKNINKPIITMGRVYEVDEMRTYLGKKSRLIWIVYALDRYSKEVVDFNVGSRTNKTLSRVITTLELSTAKRIYTDKLKNYQYIINEKLHKTTLFQTNHIERNNLTIRTHLKRLNRKTICFSRSFLILFAVLKIYFWG